MQRLQNDGQAQKVIEIKKMKEYSFARAAPEYLTYK